MTLNVLSLFSGIGGLELGLERAGMTTVGQVEIDDYCRRVLAKHWPHVPRHDDVRTATEWWLSEERPDVDVICGGFPCQDISNAGKQAGIIDGERSSLWTYMAHAVRVLRPRYVLMENVAAIVVRGLSTVAADLHEIGYDLRWDCLPAAAVGAPHRRDRWFGIAYPDSRGQQELTQRNCEQVTRVQLPRWNDSFGLDTHVSDAEGERRRQGRSGGPVGGGADWSRVWPQALAHPNGGRRVGRAGEQRTGRWGQPANGGGWAIEPDVGRVAHGIPARVDRLRALGNAVVPQVAEYVGRLIVDHAAGCAA